MSYFRKVLRISALDSPNVRRELARQAGAPESEWPAETPGVVSYAEYQKRLATWDAARVSIGIEGQFYEGREVRLFPADWLAHSDRVADELRGTRRTAKAIGVDPAEGGDHSSWSVVDEFGLIELVSMQTPDTSTIPNTTLGLMSKYGVPSHRVAFDRGGGGKEHADYLRSRGYDVVTVAFGESPTPDPRHGTTSLPDRIGQREDRYAYVNRRAEMYGTLRELIRPDRERQVDVPRTDGNYGPKEKRTVTGFGIPAEYHELRRQLAPIPLVFDGEGRLRLPPKNHRTGSGRERSLVEILGRSPDDADALVLGVHAMLNRSGVRYVAGVL